MSDSTVKVCKISGRSFVLTPQEKAFLETHGLPEPQIHPDEREKIRRSNMYNKAFYKTKDALTGEDIYVCINPMEHPTWKFYSKASFLKIREKTNFFL